VSASTLAIFQFAGLKASLFAANSRYQGIGTNTLTTASGQTIVYLQRRFVPQASAFAVLQQYTVKQGDRLDKMASSLLGDPQLYWRLCDANGAMRPEDIEAEWLVLNVTLPQGIPGPPNA
jgi:nucleoid-associated protein YgaU